MLDMVSVLQHKYVLRGITNLTNNVLKSWIVQVLIFQHHKSTAIKYKPKEYRYYFFGHENKQPPLLYMREEKFKDQWNLLLFTENENKHCGLTKHLNNFIHNQIKQISKIVIENTFTCI